MENILKGIDTVGEIISFGVVITIEGILVVFSILILIMLTIYAMSLFSGNKPKKETAHKQNSLAAKTESVVEVAESTDEIDEYELIAVLTAAVAACMGTSSASVNIKSYKKVSSAWGNAAKREVLEKF